MGDEEGDVGCGGGGGGGGGGTRADVGHFSRLSVQHSGISPILINTFGVSHSKLLKTD